MNSVGDIWRQIDLHVHTPFSLATRYGDKNKDRTWDHFCIEIENLGTRVSVLGVNDYWTIEGYQKLLDFRKKGRLKNVDLILPVVEMRLAEAKNHKKLQNYHVAFSPEVREEVIKEYFIDELKCEVYLDNELQSFKRTSVSLVEYGRKLFESGVLASDQSPRTDDDFKKIGNEKFTVSLELVKDLLKRRDFRGKFFTLVGYSETKPLSDKGFEGLEKQALLSADAAFLASPTDEAFCNNQRRLESLAPDTPLLHCSDAHRFDDGKEETRHLGKSKMWARCSPNFESLRFAVKHSSSRLSYDVPPEKIQKNGADVNILRKVHVESSGSAPTPKGGLEFCYGFDVNPGYTVILGNKGQGKSALTDWISAGTTKEQFSTENPFSSFSFLNDRRYQPSRKNSNNAEKVATCWKGKDPVEFLWRKGELPQVQRVDYYPQRHLEYLCTSDPDSEAAEELEGIIRKLLFKQLPLEIRQNYNSVGELIDRELKSISEANGHLVSNYISNHQALSSVLSRIVQIERMGLDKKEAELQQLLASAESQSGNAAKDTEEHVSAGELLRRLSESQQQWLNNKGPELSDALSAFDPLLELEDLINKKIDSALQDISPSSSGLLSAERLHYKEMLQSSAEPLRDFLNTWSVKVAELQREYKGLLKAGLEEADCIGRASQDLQIAIQAKLEEGAKEERERKRIAQIKFGKTSPENDTWSLSGIQDLRTQLNAKVEESRQMIHKLAAEGQAVLQGVASAASKANSWFEHIMEEFKFNEAGVNVNVRLADRLSKEQFCKGFKKVPCEDEIEELFAAREEILSKDEIFEKSGIVGYLERVVEFAKMVERKRAYSARSDYDLRKTLESLASFADVEIRFELSLDDKPLHKLSPGERGLVLLLFILHLDLSTNVLILDQPEDNLDNETIRQRLVPAIETARQRRQVIIVTHNANIGVLGDPDQVVCCSFQDKRFSVKTGSLSERWVQERVLQLLEGAREAFQMRSERYGLGKLN